MTEEAFVAQMQKYMPAAACRVGYKWLSRYPARLKVSKPRKSKLGDFRTRDKKSLPTISVNGNLKPYSFVVTFAHEVAHLIDYTKRQTLRNPHGTTWKAEYTRLLNELLEHEVFPFEIKHAIRSHADRPKAASCSDPELMELLRIFDDEPGLTLKHIPEGSTFVLNGNRIFKKGSLRRTRYKCTELSTGKTYLVHCQSVITLSDT